MTGGTDPSGSLWVAPSGNKGQGFNHDYVGELANRKARRFKKDKRKLLHLGLNNPRQQYRLGSDRLESGFAVEVTYIIYRVANASSICFQ